MCDNSTVRVTEPNVVSVGLPEVAPGLVSRASTPVVARVLGSTTFGILTVIKKGKDVALRCKVIALRCNGIAVGCTV